MKVVPDKLRQLRNPKLYLMLATDAAFFVAALGLAYGARLDFQLLPLHWEQMGLILPWFVPLKIALFVVFGLYRGMWRYTGLRDLARLGQATLAGTFMLFAVLVSRYRFENFSRSVVLLDGLFTLLFAGGVRMGIRLFFARQPRAPSAASPEPGVVRVQPRRVAVIGAGSAGLGLEQELRANARLHSRVVCFIDDDPGKIGRTIRGIPIFGPVDSLPAIVAARDIGELLIAIPSATGDQMRRLVALCEACGVPFKTLPGLGEIVDGRVLVKAIRAVDYRDLLGREAVQLDAGGIADYVKGRVVLVTGCGGSIGSELCRQIVRFQPERLVLLDNSEANLYAIDMELRGERGFTRGVPVLGSVTDEALVDDVVTRHKPSVIFHAAAYKHVPMLEDHPWQAVLNNVLGSRIVMEAAARHRADRFVLVSTDKAVRPTNVMGTTKRIAEILLQSMPGPTRFMAVRFGNVLGSVGSVVPLFQRQIERGGPVTVSHPDVTRYFMTIPEAVQLILQAGSLGEGGEIFVLEMGQPVRIVDLARDLIRLSGREPDRDIPIVFTGLRPGEKLYEELATAGENVIPTRHAKIRRQRVDAAELEALRTARADIARSIDELVDIAQARNAAALRLSLGRLVPEYKPAYHAPGAGKTS